MIPQQFAVLCLDPEQRMDPFPDFSENGPGFRSDQISNFNSELCMVWVAVDPFGLGFCPDESKEWEVVGLTPTRKPFRFVRARSHARAQCALGTGQTSCP